jgi:serine/threonine-protein kinase CHEK1
LDGDGNLKIADFGLATLFRQNGVRRTLQTPCGTPPYIAPEVSEFKWGYNTSLSPSSLVDAFQVLEEAYEGDAVDVWSCGVILYALLAGSKS